VRRYWVALFLFMLLPLLIFFVSGDRALAVFVVELIMLMPVLVIIHALQLWREEIAANKGRNKEGD